MLSGKIGRDPEFSISKNGTAICKLTLATNESVKKGNEWERLTEWHNIVIFGGRGEYIAKNCLKGDFLAVMGRIRTETWEKNGEKKSRVVIIADEVDFSPKTKNDKPKSDFQEEYEAAKNIEEKDDEDLPF